MGDAQTALPPLKSLKAVTERMLPLQQHGGKNAQLFIDDNDGRFLMAIKTEHCALKTRYENMNYSKPSQHETVSCSAKIDLKYLMKVIAALNGLATQSIRIAITQKLAVTIHARLPYRNPNEHANGDEDSQMNDENSARITFYLCVYIDDEEMSQDEEDNDNESESDDGDGTDADME